MTVPAFPSSPDRSTGAASANAIGPDDFRHRPISLAEDEIEESFIRASGPGGQNVNKVSSAVQLRFDAAASPALSRRCARGCDAWPDGKMTDAGVIVITANRFRAQERNRADAVERLVGLIAQAAHAPTPRRPTRPT